MSFYPADWPLGTNFAFTKLLGHVIMFSIRAIVGAMPGWFPHNLMVDHHVPGFPHTISMWHLRGFHSHGATPICGWFMMVYFRENPKITWMMLNGVALFQETTIWAKPNFYGQNLWNMIIKHPSAIKIWLVVWTPLKNMKVSWDDDIPNCFWKVIKFHGSKPPTSD